MYIAYVGLVVKGKKFKTLQEAVKHTENKLRKIDGELPVRWVLDDMEGREYTLAELQAHIDKHGTVSLQLIGRSESGPVSGESAYISTQEQDRKDREANEKELAKMGAELAEMYGNVTVAGRTFKRKGSK